MIQNFLSDLSARIGDLELKEMENLGEIAVIRGKFPADAFQVSILFYNGLQILIARLLLSDARDEPRTQPVCTMCIQPVEGQSRF